MATNTIYGLVDPDTRDIRYVGITANSVADRAAAHVAASTKRRDGKDHWIAELLQRGRVPFVVVLERCRQDTSDREDRASERAWMALLWRDGTLLNVDAPPGLSRRKPRRSSTAA